MIYVLEPRRFDANYGLFFLAVVVMIALAATLGDTMMDAIEEEPLPMPTQVRAFHIR